MADKFQFKRGTASGWSSVNPTLASGEPGLELDTKRIKVGDGLTSWNSLSYIYETFPISHEIAVASDDTPSGYLREDGSEVSRDTYSALFDAIGTTYGDGDGSTTFNLPDRSASDQNWFIKY